MSKKGYHQEAEIKLRPGNRQNGLILHLGNHEIAEAIGRNNSHRINLIVRGYVIDNFLKYAALLYSSKENLALEKQLFNYRSLDSQGLGGALIDVTGKAISQAGGLLHFLGAKEEDGLVGIGRETGYLIWTPHALDTWKKKYGKGHTETPSRVNAVLTAAAEKIKPATAMGLVETALNRYSTEHPIEDISKIVQGQLAQLPAQ